MTRRNDRFIALSCALVFACFGIDASGQEDGAATRPADNKAQEIARRIEKQVSSTRLLDFKTPTKIGVYSKDQLRTFLLENFDKEMSKEKADEMTRLYRMLGLLPHDFDLRTTMLDLLSEQVAGFYNPEKKELFLIEVASDDEAGWQMNDVIMSHELVHALQDQHFALEAMMADDSNSDRLAAIQALVEGDATLTMMIFSEPVMAGEGAGAVVAMTPTSMKGLAPLMEMAKKMGEDTSSTLPGQDMEQMSKAPLVISDQMIFAYMGGMKFCHALMSKMEPKSMASIDAAFKNPPRSTEQILHPEKYWKTPDWPTTITIPDLAPVLGPGWSRLVGDTIGELHVRTLMTEFGVKGASKIHAGWDGDRAEVWAKKDVSDTLVWTSTWDSENDAEEFETALGGVIAKHYPGYESGAAAGLWTKAGSDATCVVRRDGVRVHVLLDISAGAVEPALKLLASDAKYAEDAPSKAE